MKHQVNYLFQGQPLFNYYNSFVPKVGEILFVEKERYIVNIISHQYSIRLREMQTNVLVIKP